MFHPVNTYHSLIRISRYLSKLVELPKSFEKSLTECLEVVVTDVHEDPGWAEEVAVMVEDMAVMVMDLEPKVEDVEVWVVDREMSLSQSLEFDGVEAGHLAVEDVEEMFVKGMSMGLLILNFKQKQQHQKG